MSDVTLPQRDLFQDPPPPRRRLTERQVRDEVLNLLDAKRAKYLAALRGAMRLLVLDRHAEVRRAGHWLYVPGEGIPCAREGTAWACADDARRLFESWAPPAAIDRNFLGAVFRGKDWSALPGRRVLSTTAGSHANELKCWTLTSLSGVSP